MENPFVKTIDGIYVNLLKVTVIDEDGQYIWLDEDGYYNGEYRVINEDVPKVRKFLGIEEN